EPFSRPPEAFRATRRGVREAIAIEHGPDFARGAALKRIAFEQREHGRRSFEQTLTELLEPGLIVVAAERGKPHLPVEARLMRRNPWRTAMQVAGLVLELVGLPLDAVVGSLDDDLRPRDGHHREQAV